MSILHWACADEQEPSAKTVFWNGAREPLSEETSHSFLPPASHLPEVTKEGGIQCILCAVKAARHCILGRK